MRRIVRWLGLLQADKADSHQSVELATMTQSFHRLVKVFTLTLNILTLNIIAKVDTDHGGVIGHRLCYYQDAPC